ncbi:MAG: heavy-metal-associated domain-containing protein [Propionivibrio sp.]|nr:heavy-metal-associated domain-containing protein [Propionivibrio sp.]
MGMSSTSDARATAATISLPIEGMACASCVGRVESALSRVEGVGSVSAHRNFKRFLENSFRPWPWDGDGG